MTEGGITDRLTQEVDRLLGENARLEEEKRRDAGMWVRAVNDYEAKIEKLQKAIKQAIRQHEEGNKGLAHRTLCEAVYGRQA